MNSIFTKIITEEKELLELINNRNAFDGKLITYFNQHCYNIYYSNYHYRNLIERHFVLYADGIGMKLALKILSGKNYKNYNATDLNQKIIETLTRNNVRFYIIGGNFNKEEMNLKFSNACLVGYHSGFFEDNQIPQIVGNIKSVKPEIVFIGMGVPAQELLADIIAKEFDTALYICVGNFFEFFLNRMKRVPLKYRNKGLEWLFRLFVEPKRLWSRYIIGIPLFIFRIIRLKYVLYRENSK